MRSYRILKSVLAGLALLVLGTNANATLIGDNVNCTGTVAPCSAPSAVVSAGPEFVLNTNFWSLDITNDSIIISAMRQLSIGGASSASVTIGDLDWLGIPQSITDVTLDNLVGVNDSLGDNNLQNNISFTSDSVTFGFGGTSWSDAGARLELVMATQSAQVPVPATVLLLLTGLGIIRLNQRRLS